MYDPNKEKIRVAFDCSIEPRGRSLNEELITRSDLSNLIVSVSSDLWRNILYSWDRLNVLPIR